MVRSVYPASCPLASPPLIDMSLDLAPNSTFYPPVPVPSFSPRGFSIGSRPTLCSPDPANGRVDSS